MDIKKVTLSGYSNGNVMINVGASSTASYDRLVLQMLEAGFPMPSFNDRILNQVTLITSDTALMASFLLALREVAAELLDIEEDISTTLGIDLDVCAKVPAWHKTGDFNEVFLSPIRRQVNYRTGAKESMITEFSLSESYGRDYLFSMELAGDDSIKLKQALNESGLPVIVCKQRVEFSLKRGSAEQFYQLLALISEHSMHFAQISDDFKEHVSQGIKTQVFPSTLFGGTPDKLAPESPPLLIAKL